MKSIVQEASSIEKAVVQAWQRAGQPEDFSVRIFEVPQKNFFGFTVKSAKIAIFFQEQPKKREATGRQQQSAQPAAQAPQPKEKLSARPLTPKPTVQREKRREQTVQPEAATEKPKQDGQLWSPTMVQYVQGWFDDLCATVGRTDLAFSIDQQKYHLKVLFAKAPFAQDEQCKAFYRSCAYLVLQSLRNNCKRPLKGFKVICTHVA